MLTPMDGGQIGCTLILLVCNIYGFVIHLSMENRLSHFTIYSCWSLKSLVQELMLFHSSDKRVVQELRLFHNNHPSANAIPQAGDYSIIPLLVLPMLFFNTFVCHLVNLEYKWYIFCSFHLCSPFSFWDLLLLVKPSPTIYVVSYRHSLHKSNY